MKHIVVAVVALALLLSAGSALAAGFVLNTANVVNLKDMTVVEESVVFAEGPQKGWAVIEVAPPGEGLSIAVYCPVKMAPTCNLARKGQLVKRIRGYLSTIQQDGEEVLVLVANKRMKLKK